MAEALAKYRINPGNVGSKRHDDNFETIIASRSSTDEAGADRRQLGLARPALLTELMDAQRARRASP